MDKLYCPYCDHDCGDYFDDMHDSNVDYEWECEGCEKSFIFTIEYDPTFTGHKADCLNGGEHKWENSTIPKGNHYRCADCGKTKIVAEALLNEGDKK